MNETWIAAFRDTVASYRKMIDATIEQLSDAELQIRPSLEINSVAIILRHLGGNLRSRWTDFLTTDGEKPDRNRDTEFQDWDGDRESLLAWFDEGWQALTNAIDQLDDSNITDTIYIRGEAHTIPQALARSVTHLTYHVGQIAMVSRMVHEGDWQWLTIAPGQSTQHNQRTWGSQESRSVFGRETDDESRPSS